MKKIALNNLIWFIKEPGKHVQFTILFYSFWFIINAVENADFNLTSFIGRPIGSATLDAFDVGLRVAFFYKCVAFFFLAFLFLNVIALLINLKLPDLIKSVETRIINYASIAGILLYVFKIFDSQTYESLELIYFIHKLAVVGLIIKFLFFRKSKLTFTHYSLVICLASALFFLLADLYNFLGHIKSPDFYIVTFLLTGLLIVLVHLFLTSKIEQKQNKLSRIINMLAPLMFLPLASVLKDELFLVFKTNQIEWVNQAGIYIVLLLFIVSAGVFKYKRFRNDGLSDKETLMRTYVPLLLFSILTFCFYNHLAEYYDELFESGNVYLPLMEFKQFGIIPPIEKLNTHLFSDNFFAIIYTYFNGLKINEADIYDFLLVPCSFTLFYYLLLFLTRNGYVAFFSVIILPYANAFLPGGYCLAIIGIISSYKLINNTQTIKNYLQFFSLLLFLICWRIDLAFSSAATVPIILLYYNFNGSRFKINWRMFTLSLLVFLTLLTALLTCVALYRNIDFLARSREVLNYCLSAQSYGYHTIGWSNLPAYKMHYFVFPATVGVIILMLIIKHNELNKLKSDRRAYLSLLFICLFYVFNFNRGLIRHSLIEGNDSFTSSFFYIIIASTVYVFYKKRSQAAKFITYIIVIFLVMNNYRHPDLKDQNPLFESFIDKIKAGPIVGLDTLNTRIKNRPKDAGKKYNDFINFITKNTAPDETYIDFSNRPMLHFYTKKETPAGFYQNPLCLINDFLQQKFIDDLAKYKAPYLLFCELNDLGFEVVDGIPNALRHYRMAEWFYNCYEPAIVLNNYCVWKKKSTADKNRVDTVYHFMNNQVPNDSENKIKLGIHANLNKKYLFKLVCNNGNPPDIKTTHCVIGNSNPVKLFKVSETEFLAELTPQQQTCSLEIMNEAKTIEEVIVLEGDYLPDYFSKRYLNYNLEKLPYVWGNYDDLVDKETVLINKEIKRGNLSPFIDFPIDIDKTSGNTLLINCKNSGSVTKQIEVSFRHNKDKNCTKILCDVLPSKDFKRYAVRTSFSYNWYSKNVNQITISTGSDKDLIINKLSLTKGK